MKICPANFLDFVLFAADEKEQRLRLLNAVHLRRTETLLLLSCHPQVILYSSLLTKEKH